MCIVHPMPYMTISQLEQTVEKKRAMNCRKKVFFVQFIKYTLQTSEQKKKKGKKNRLDNEKNESRSQLKNFEEKNKEHDKNKRFFQVMRKICGRGNERKWKKSVPAMFYGVLSVILHTVSL